MQLLEEIDRLQEELLSPPGTLSAAWLLLDQHMKNISGLLDMADRRSMMKCCGGPRLMSDSSRTIWMI